MSTFQEYMTQKAEFFKKHGECRIHDHGMKSNDSYFKVYDFEDGANWCELSGPVFEGVTVEVRGIKVKTSVKLFRTEYWSSEAGSQFFYDRY